MSELGPNNWFHVPQTRWGDWVEPYSTRKAQMYQAIWMARFDAARGLAVLSAFVSLTFDQQGSPAAQRLVASPRRCAGARLTPARSLPPHPRRPAAQTARNSSSKGATSSTPNAMGYAAAPPAQGQNGGGCVGTFFFSFGWIWQASSTWINLVNGYNYTWGASGPANGVMGKTMAGNELADPVDAIIRMYSGATPVNSAPVIAAPGLMMNGYTYDNSVTVRQICRTPAE